VRTGRPTIPNRKAVVRFTISMDPELYEWVTECAEIELRTIHAQISYILQQARDAEILEGFER
jgi:hypothetical protein